MYRSATVHAAQAAGPRDPKGNHGPFDRIGYEFAFPAAMYPEAATPARELLTMDVLWNSPYTCQPIMNTVVLIVSRTTPSRATERTYPLTVAFCSSLK